MSNIENLINEAVERSIVVEKMEEKETKAHKRPVWPGSRMKYWLGQLRDWYRAYFFSRRLLVVRLRKNHSIDHKIFIMGEDHAPFGCITWDNQVYDIEPAKVWNDRGEATMFVVEGLRLPLDMLAFVKAASKAAEKVGQDLTAEYLEEFGGISIDAYDANIKMNNRDAEKLAAAAQLDYIKYAMYFSGIAMILAGAAFAAMMGWIDTPTEAQLDAMRKYLVEQSPAWVKE